MGFVIPHIGVVMYLFNIDNKVNVVVVVLLLGTDH